MKSLKKNLIPRSLWLVIGFLAGAAMAATAESPIRPESGRHDATLTLTTTPTPQISSGNCQGSNCLTNAVVTLSRLDGSPISTGTPALLPSDGGKLTVSNISRLNSSPSGLIALQNGDRTIRNPSNLALANANPQPQLHLTTATMRVGVSSPYVQGSAGGMGSIIRELFCSSPRQGCISEILFNSNPTIKSAPTGKVTLAPEPTAAFLLGTGLLAIGLIRRRQKTGRS